MPTVLDLLTPANLVYADRVRALSPTSVQYDPALVFERAEPDLKVHSVFESYDDNYFLCEHADGAGWSFITVQSPCDHRGVPYRLSYFGTTMRDVLFKAWLTRPAPQPLTTLFGEVVEGVRASELDADAEQDSVQTLMLLRLTGADGDALRALAALGTWPPFVMTDLDPEVLTGKIENITVRRT